jgi:hypothetical protein
MKETNLYKKAVVLIIFISAILWGYTYIDNNIPDAPGELTKKQLIEIARKAFKEQLNMDIGHCRFDRGNKIWNQYYADRYPGLSGRNYQAIECSTKQPFHLRPSEKLGGGPHWICIDKKTGEVLQYDMGM